MRCSRWLSTAAAGALLLGLAGSAAGAAAPSRAAGRGYAISRCGAPRGTTYLTYDDADYSHPGAVLTLAKAARREHVGLGVFHVASVVRSYLKATGVDIPDRLLCCEVLTPPGNWSSYPPHKHDDASNGVEAELEEIYYFRVEGPHGIAAHRTYDLVEGWDVTVTIGDGDTFLVPRGFHGPCMASPDHALWYLNVLAGPGDVRSMAISDDPAHAWIRGAWAGQTGDPRVPMATAAGRRRP